MNEGRAFPSERRRVHALIDVDVAVPVDLPAGELDELLELCVELVADELERRLLSATVSVVLQGDDE